MTITASSIPNYDVRAEIWEATQDVRAGRPPQRNTAAYVMAYLAELNKLPTTSTGYIRWG